MSQTLEEKLKSFGIENLIGSRCYTIGDVENVLDTLKQHFSYKTIQVSTWGYTGGKATQLERIKEIACMGQQALNIIKELAETGYKLDDYWDEKGSIGKDDIKVIKELCKEGMLDNYLLTLNKVRKAFGKGNFKYQATNALNMMRLSKLCEKDSDNAINFMSQGGCFCFFNDGASELSDDLLAMMNSDPKNTNKVLDSLKRNFGYKTLSGRVYDYDGGLKGQIRKVIEISKIVDKHPNIIDILAETGYKLDTYWDEKGSIGNGDVQVLSGLCKPGVLEKYFSLMDRIKLSFGVKKFSYKADNALFIMSILKFDEEKQAGIIEFLNNFDYFDSFSKENLKISYSTLEAITKSDIKAVSELSKNLKKNFRYTSINVRSYAYNGGIEGQVNKILELAGMGSKSLSVLDALTSAGYKLDTYWDEKGSIGQEDVTVVKKLLDEKELEKCLNLMHKIPEIFKTKKDYRADNILFIMNMLKFGEDKAFSIARFIKNSRYDSFFSKPNSSLPEGIIEKAANSGHEIVTQVFEKLRKRLGYKTVEVNNWDYTGGIKGQMGRVLEIASLGESALQTLDTLADTGYKLDTYWDSKGSIGNVDVRIVRKLSETNTSERYKEIITLLKQMGYTPKDRHKEREFYEKEIEHIVRITMLPGDPLEALTRLSKKGFRIDNSYVSLQDVETIAKSSEQIWDEKLKPIEIGHKCFYKEDAKSFIKYFSSIKTEQEKKRIIKALMACPHNNEQVIKWLDENEHDLVREVGLLY